MHCVRMLFFFFSSRRRHTRYWRDWSSDVCSSDLGAVAGLIGLPDLLGRTYHFGTEFTAGLGFLGIAVALLGRNSPLGIAFAALLFAFLDRAAVPLQFADIPASVVTIIQIGRASCRERV